MNLQKTKIRLEKKIRMLKVAADNWSQIQLEACRENNGSKVIRSIIEIDELIEKKDKLIDQLIRVLTIQEKINQI